jgi:hypothetical protein
LAVDPNVLAVSKCYVTRNGQVRRITKIEGNCVWYDSRGRQLGKGWSIGTTAHRPPSKEFFARSVKREVSCEWEHD